MVTDSPFIRLTLAKEGKQPTRLFQTVGAFVVGGGGVVVGTVANR